MKLNVWECAFLIVVAGAVFGDVDRSLGNALVALAMAVGAYASRWRE